MSKSRINKAVIFSIVCLVSCSPVTTPVVNVQNNNNPTFTNSPTTNQNPVSNTSQKTDQTQNNTVSSENNNIEGYDGFQNQSQEKIDSTEDTDGLGGKSSNVYQYNGVDFYGQCVPAARRYVKAKYGYSFPLLGGIGNTGAYLFWDKVQPDLSKMERISYTGNNLPKADDVIIYKPWKTNPYGHIAITKSVDNNGNITVVDSNWVKYEKGGEHVVKKSELSLIYGWYRAIQNKSNMNNVIDSKPIPVIVESPKQNKNPIINSFDVTPSSAIVTQERTIITTEKQPVITNTPAPTIAQEPILNNQLFSPNNLTKSSYLTSNSFSENIKLEANSFSGYGEFDGKSDIIYDKQYGQWNFTSKSSQAKIKIKGALWEGATSYYTDNFKIQIYSNNKLVYDSRSPFQKANIVNYNYNLNLSSWDTITNWQMLELPLNNLSSSNNLTIVNNNGGSVWLAIDSIELI